MRFLALSAPAAYALLAGVALVIVLLHLLRPPRPRLLVPSMLVWARTVRARKRPVTRRLLALLLALGVGLGLALALTHPEVPALAPSSERLLLILDNSASLAARTRDGHSRWQHALEQARALLRRSGAPTQVLLWDTRGQLRASAFLDRDAALAALGRVPSADWGSLRLPPAPLAAGAQVHLFTDGVAPLDTPPGAIVHSAFEPADNAGITAFEARPLARDPTRYEALVQVLNASPRGQRVRLLVTGGDGFSIVQDLDLAAGESANATFDVSDFTGGVLGASVICATDAFPLDDVAYAIVPHHRRKRVLLVTTGNPPLENALRQLPGVRLTVVPPQGYLRAGEHDALVFDRFAPAQPPVLGALLLRPPARDWLAGGSKALAAPRITSWNPDHAVSGGIGWRNLRLARASITATAEFTEGLVMTGGAAPGALVTAGQASARWIKVGFALADSNFAFQPDFPVFLGNALSWVGESMPVLKQATGSVEVPLRDARIRDSGGRAMPVVATAQGVAFEAWRPDVYTVTSAGKEALVLASLPDPRAALINRSPLDSLDTSAVAGGGAARWWDAELWMLLLLLAAALLLVDWALFTRRGAG